MKKCDIQTKLRERRILHLVQLPPNWLSLPDLRRRTFRPCIIRPNLMGLETARATLATMTAVRLSGALQHDVRFRFTYASRIMLVTGQAFQ